ncbi:MAG: hypothetical protein EAX96_03760 [Candidatus Lokiarchaeota archaeon]|nr:hypothetical protein [Candidatus Lokiarchaeota archaeon]
MSLKEEKVVSPGEKIGVIEMYEPGEGAYEDKGVIYSKVLGKMRVNTKARKVNVIPLNPGALPKKGEILTARVIVIKKQQTLIDIVPSGDLNPKFVFEGSIHISNASDQYIDSMNDAFKPYDVLRVKVIEVENQPFQCITSQNDLGVILAFCSECGEELARDRGNRLICPACRNIEQRKLANDYGKFEFK